MVVSSIDLPYTMFRNFGWMKLTAIELMPG
jgi:hypothetical protein